MKFDILFEIEVPRPWDRGKEARIFHECIEQAVFAERTRQSGIGGGTVGGNWAERLVPTPSHDGYIDSGAFCIGDPARCIDTVGRYRDVGADRLVSVMQLGDIRHEDLMHNIEMFGNHVIPAFR